LKETVQMLCHVARNGTLIEAKALSGPEALIPAAKESVAHWRWRPIPQQNPTEYWTECAVKFDLPTDDHVLHLSDGPPVTKKIQPIYPELAKKGRIQGPVQLRIQVGKDGRVKKITTLSGHPLLVPAAVKAVSQWRFAPALLNNRPIAYETDCVVNFNLEK
jgi:TonB family protein